MSENQTTQFDTIDLAQLNTVTGGGVFGAAWKLAKKAAVPAVAAYSGWSGNKAYHEARDKGKSVPSSLLHGLKNAF